MKLVVEDDKDTSCNGNGILDDQIKKMISEAPKVSSNGDVHNDDSRSNSDSLNGSGDLLIEDPTNTVRNGSDDSSFQNGSKPDDTRSWSSNSSNFPPPDIDEDLSDEMTLRLSDEEDESENTPSESTNSKKDSVLQHTSSPLPMADQNTLSDKNQTTKLIEDDTQSNTDQQQSDIVSDTPTDEKLGTLISEIMPNTSIIDIDKDKSVTELREEMEELLNEEDSDDLAQIDGKNHLIDNDVLSDVDLNSSTSTISISLSNEESLSELNKETKVDPTLLDEEKTHSHSEKSVDRKDTVTKTNESDEIKEVIDDINEETQEKIKDDNSFKDKEKTKNDSSLEDKEKTKNVNSFEDKEKTKDDNSIVNSEKTNDDNSIVNLEKTNDDNSVENKEKINDDNSVENKEEEENDSLNKDQMETEKISEDISELDKNKELNISSKENKEESNKDVAVVLIENSEETVDKNLSVVEKSDSVSVSEKIKNDAAQINTEATVINDDVDISVKDNDESIKRSNDDDDDKTNAIIEPMEIESNEKIFDQSTTSTTNVMLNDSEPMEVDSNDDIAKVTDATNNAIVEEPTKNNSSIQINEDKKSGSLVDSKDIDETKSKSESKVDIIEEDIKGIKDEEPAKSLKRSLETDAEEIDPKKPKIIIKPKEKRDYVPLNYFRDFLSKKEVKTLTREELEEFCVQKMCESINQTSKVGDLNRLVKQQEQVIESLRTKYNGLKKQIGDISIVQNKMLQEVRAAKAKDGGSANVMPVKITRSVGLQVSLQPSNRVRPIPASPSSEQLAAAPLQKRKVQRISLPNKLPSAQTPVTPITPAKPVSATVPKSPNVIPSPTSTPVPAPASSANKTIKTILPRAYNGPDTNKDVSSTNTLLGNYLTNPSPKPSAPIVVRKTMTPTNAVSSTATTTSATSTKVIDLTDEDDIAKTASAVPATPAGIRVVAPHQLNNTSTAVTSQMQRVTYLVSPNGQQGQVLLATTSAPTRPGGPRSTIMFKPVQQGQVPNGQRLNFVRPHTSGGTLTVVPATSTASIRPGQQIRFQTSGTTVNSIRPQMISSTRITPTQRHPAPLPGPPAVQPSQPTWKAMPPKPSLKISKVGDGIVLSWKMLNKDMSLYEDIASYQLYAYQETNALPSTDMWRKVGDVKALALPMACTLTQFTDGNKYHFAVRAVDVKSRVGPFSQPEQIALP